MRLDMVKRYAFCIEETLECSDLVADHSRQLFWCELHLSSSKALNIWQSRMCTGFYVVLLHELDGLLHDERVTGVKAACYLESSQNRKEL